MWFLKFLVIICSILSISCSTTNQSAISSDLAESKMRRGLEYTCRFDNGKIAVTTDPAAANSPKIDKADIFIEKSEYTPVDITGLDLEKVKANADRLKFFEEIVVINLTEKTMDWKVGEAETIDLSVDAQLDLPENERTIKITRIKTHPKMTLYAKNLFSRVTGSELAVGAEVHLHQGVVGKVVSIDDNEVRVEFEPESDQPIEGTFGLIAVEDKGDHYQIEVDAYKGRLVRVGPAVGRIAEVNEKSFKIDYSHPFGGERLICDTKIVAMDAKQVFLAQDARNTKPEGGSTAAEKTKDSGVSTKQATTATNNQTIVQSGDLAKVVYTAYLKSTKELVYTTHSDFAEDPKKEKIEGYRERETYGPETILVGGEDGFPGVAEATEGMSLGRGKRITVPAARVFGDRNPSLMRQYDRTKIVPQNITLPAQQYVKQFGGFPVKGKTVDVNAYTTGKVADVTEQGAVLEMFPVAAEVDSDFGLTKMQVIGGNIHIHLTPKLGADFELENKKGKVVAVDNRKFTVDFNEPLAGEDVVVDILVIGLTKASSFAGKDIQWIEDYAKGLEAAETQKKPTVLVLYADWCKYCEKLFKTTLIDPRIKMMHDEFVWVKVNSDKDKSLKALYEQKGFPLTVVLNSNGDVVNSIKGYKDAMSFQSELKKALNKSTADKKLDAEKKAGLNS